MDLFGSSLIPGLRLGDDLVGRADEEELIQRIAALPLAPFRFQGFTGKRLTHSFGWHYDFQKQVLTRAEPIPPWLQPLQEKAARFAGIDPEEIMHALVIRYDPGAAIGWHRDRPVFDQVIGVSLGAPTVMSFRRRAAGRFRRLQLPLAPRSVYLLSGEARHDWEHSIRPHAQQRFSITFRTFAAHAKRLIHR